MCSALVQTYFNICEAHLSDFRPYASSFFKENCALLLLKMFTIGCCLSVHIFHFFFFPPSLALDMSFQCLGSWPGENGETYMSLLDTKLPQLGEEPRPRYRCAVSPPNFTFPFFSNSYRVLTEHLQLFGILMISW